MSFDYATTKVLVCTECGREYTEKEADEDENQLAPCGHDWGWIFDFKPDCMTEEEHKNYVANRLLKRVV